MSSKLATYEYDSLGRLIQVNFPNGASATYAYDAAGNRTTVVEIPALNPPLVQPTVAAFSKKNCGDQVNNAMLVKLSNGEIVGWGDNTHGMLSNGIAAATNQPPQRVVFDPNTTMPPFDATIVDWVFTNANLYVVFSNGWVYSCGQNAYGQTGHGEATSVVRTSLKRIEYFVGAGKSVEKVWACGARSTTDGGGCVYFQTSDKTMYGCGANAYGNLGLAAPNATTNQNTPMPCVGLPSSPNYVEDVAIVCGNNAFSTYMRTNDNKLYVAGNNAHGQLGDDTTATVSGTFKQALKFGGVPADDFVFVSPNAGWNASAVSGNALAIDVNGDVWTTGYNGHGALGQGNTTNLKIFTKVPGLSNINAAELGGGFYAYGYALDNAGNFYTWGYNGVNNLFKNNTTAQPSPTVNTAIPGTIAKVFFPKDDYLVSDAQLMVLTDTGRLAYAGVANGQIGIASAAHPNAYNLVAMPRELLDGTETIADVFVHGSGTTQRWFVLTSVGNLYSFGNNADAVAIGGIASNANPASVTGFKLNIAPAASE